MAEIKKELTILSNPSCTSVGENDKAKAYSNYDLLIKSIIEDAQKGLRQQLAEFFDESENYGKTLSIELQYNVSNLAADLSHSKVA